jgi:signal transduction histidine kinase
MSDEFIREKLFKPFQSTKSAGMGIGVFESREYVSELGGQIEVSSSQSDGTVFRVVLPLHRSQQAGGQRMGKG